MIKKYLITSIILTIIIILSLIPIPEVKPLEGVPLIDKWTHMIMYAGLTGAMMLDCMRNKIKASVKMMLIFLMIAIVVGGALELLQPLVCRSCEMLDWIADSIGGVLGIVAGYFVLSAHRE